MKQLKMERLSQLLATMLAIVMIVSSTGCDNNGKNLNDEETTAISENVKVEETTLPVPDPNKRYKISYYGYWCGSDYEPGNYVEKLISDALNIDIEVKRMENNEAVNIMLATGAMPDCLWLDKNPIEMKDQELIRTIPVDMVKEYAPSFIKLYDRYPVMYANTLSKDDNNYFDTLVGVTLQFVDYFLPNDYYRYDWIQELGIDLDVNVEQISDNIYVADDGITVAKFEEIMKKFVHNDPDKNGKADTVGINGPNLTQGPFFSGFGFAGGINNVNGEAVQWYATPGYKEYLKFMSKMYKDGLIDPQLITPDRHKSWERVNKEEAGYWITSTNSLNSWAVERPPLSLIEKKPNVKILMTPGLKPKGGKVMARTSSSPAYGHFYVNANVKDDKKLAKILQFVEYCNFSETRASHFFGEEGVDWKMENGTPVKINQLPSGTKGTWSFCQHAQDEEVMRWTSYEPMFEAGLKYWSKEKNGLWMKFQEPNFKEDIRGETKFLELSNEYGPDIYPYTETYRVECILGKKDVDSTWDTYLKELDRLGYNKMMAELEKLPPLQEIIAEYSK